MYALTDISRQKKSRWSGRKWVASLFIVLEIKGTFFCYWGRIIRAKRIIITSQNPFHRVCSERSNPWAYPNMQPPKRRTFVIESAIKHWIQYVNTLHMHSYLLLYKNSFAKSWRRFRFCVYISVLVHTAVFYAYLMSWCVITVVVYVALIILRLVQLLS
jgi:hypothetical protein